MALDASGTAGGVQSGQSLAVARSRCRDLLTLPADLTYYDGVSNGIGEALAGVVDRVEPAGRGRFHLRGDAGIQSGLWPEHRRGLELARLPDVAAGVDRVVALEPESALPERRRVFAASLRPMSLPQPVQVATLESGVPQRVGARPVQRVQDRGR